jgi:hypothetical protein
MKQLWKEKPDTLAHALAEPLKDFGYKVTDAYVKEEITKLYAGEKAVGVIAMFLDEWLKKGIESS